MRETDTVNDLRRKIRIATIIGTIQSSLTHFKYIRPAWKFNCEDERLLGVSLTGIMDSPLLNKPSWGLNGVLEDLRGHAIMVNQKVAAEIGINPSTAITCVKPSGCQKETTTIVTVDGIFTLSELGDINGAQWQDTLPTSACNETGSEPITKFYNNGFSDTKVITMTSGIVLEATLAHKYRVVGNDGTYYWKCVRDIEIGDILPYSIGSYRRDSIAQLVQLHETPAPYHNCTSITMPNVLDEDLAWFLGLYHGDGSNHKKGIRIAGCLSKLSHLERASDIIFRKFGIKCLIYERPKTSTVSRDLYANSTHLLKWLVDNNLSKPYSLDMKIPLSVRKSPPDVIEAFIDGYWHADGSTMPGSGGRSIVTISKIMAEQLVTCIRALGNSCSVREMPPTESSYGTNMRYWIAYQKGWSGNYTRRNDSKLFELFLKHQLNDTLVPDTVKSIVDSSCATYDIEVPNGNTYIANSYVSHNTVSQLVDAASGIHPRHSRQYLRTVRCDKKDPMYQFLKDQNIPVEDDVMRPDSTAVFTFAIKSPQNAVLRDDIDAIQQLELWKTYSLHWCEHKPSITVTVREEEWLKVGAWVYDNFDIMSGVSFLPHSDHCYQQSPYQDVSIDEWNKAYERLPKHIDWSQFSKYEITDHTAGAKTYACTGGACEQVDLV